jgi:glycosyltransferase involved in cell wall biosynthesis
VKILVVSLHHVEYAIELARALSEEHRVRLILSRPKVSRTVDGDLSRLLGAGVRCILLDKYSGRNPLIIRNFLTILKVFSDFRPDIIHVQECRDLTNFACFLSPAPVVVTVHDINRHPGDKRNVVLDRLARLIRRSLYSKIIVHGKSLKRDLVENIRRTPEDVFAIPHGCLFSFGNTPQDSASAEEEHSVLFLGRIHKYKGLQHLIEAEPIVSQRFPDFKIIVAGQGDDLATHKEHLKENVHFEVHDRYIPNAEVASFFNRSAMVITPYIEASQSGIIAMAFAFGKPVITTDVGSLPEMVDDGKTGLIVPPRSVERLAEAIIRLLEDRDKRRKMGREALKTAKTSLSWGHIANCTAEVYERTLRQN